jgi:signal transduction histidine kinase
VRSAERDDVRWIVLDHDANSLSVSVSAIALSASLPVEYRYKASGGDDAWVINTTGDIQFPALAPGSYTMVMQARYAGGEWGNATTLRVDVKYPYWRSWWFILVIAAALSAIVWGIAVLVTRRRETEAHERESLLHEERLRIAKDLHDDVGTGLAKIVILSENALADSAHDDTARIVADTAREVIDSVRSIVWVMKSSDESLASALGYVKEKIGDLFGDKGIAFVYEQRVPEDLHVDLIVRRNIVLAVKEIATNVVRHSGARNVKVVATMVKDGLIIEIRDDGAGFDADHNGNGSGIANIKARMTEVGGAMVVETQPGLGTRITLTIPIAGTSQRAT